jgi:hypothetical protein
MNTTWKPRRFDPYGLAVQSSTALAFEATLGCCRNGPKETVHRFRPDPRIAICFTQGHSEFWRLCLF